MDATSTTEPFRFTPNAAPAGGEDPLVRETRREIAAIVRDTAQLARQDLIPARFFTALADRTARAMAAEGVVIWRRRESAVGEVDKVSDFAAVTRVGRITDQTIDSSQWGCHAKMLSEIADSDQPAVVPSTPDARDASLPSNPTLAAAAVVPILESPTQRSEYVLEVFLEGDGGPATQRGYLRFAAQMADLAGDYLRLHRIRAGQRAQQRWDLLADVLPSLHRSLDAVATASRIVDAAVEVFQSDRASLCRVDNQRATLLAVSHVDQIDSRSDDAKQIRQLALCSEPWCDAASATEPPAERSQADDAHPDDGREEASHEALHAEAVLPIGEEGAYRLVLQRRQRREWDEGQRRDLIHFCEHAAGALDNSETYSRIPWARAATSLLPAAGRWQGSRMRWLGILAAVCILGVVAVIPVPLVVTARAELAAIGTQFLYAPSDGVVTEVFVQHGQPVQSGDVLLTITDRDLEDQIEILSGQRAVLVERSAELSTSLTDGSLRRREDQTRLQGEKKVLAQQLASIDRQLALHYEQRERLTLRSQRDGVVDGWQLSRTLQGRPVSAGQALLSVIDPATGWQVQAYVPQNRLDHVLAAAQHHDGGEEVLHANVILDSHPQHSYQARLVDLGPAITLQADVGPAARALFALPPEGLPELQTGSPAEIAIDCGKRPLLYVAFQDLIRSLRAHAGMYL
ncbi:HlyD family efflux transporter periplasmic adaptor subunit [Roseimaritima ulvae]|uniref:HlyD family secretion protein n=1 Tax=Roseimaritima ulvae TaxID=980254 RepID=A0A5B9QQY3_9BACT|nr:HlyD family efflux transporter periplasmic adaptor subunit [Roseimaritima ulvae]QEG39446.1 HlyD family secretion protein [Roseimaritima ulvae]